MGVKNKGTILFTNHFDLGWKENLIPWSFPGNLLWFQRNRGAPPKVSVGLAGGPKGHVKLKFYWSFQRGGEGEKNLHEKVWVFSGMIQSEFE